MDDRDDSAAVLVDEEGPPVSNGRILDELDPRDHQPTGFKLFVPTEREKRRMEDRVAEEAPLCEKAYEGIYSRMRENLDAYEALPDRTRDDFMTLPYGKRDVNHLAAFFVNRIYNKNPIVSVTPEEFGQYQVPVPQLDPATGQTMRDPYGQTLSQVQMRSAEDLADGGERLMEHYLKGPKLKFHEFLYTTIMSCVQGAPSWGKTAYSRVMRPQLVPKWKRASNGMVVTDGYTEVERVIASPHKLIAKSGFDIMMADPWLDPQEAELIFDHCPMTIAEGRQKFNSNEWYLCTDDDWTEIRKAVGDLKRYEDNGSRAEARNSDRPRNFLDIFYIPIFWPVIFADETGQDVEGVFSLELCWERTTGKILAAPLNQYAHGMRNLVPYVQRPRPFEIGSYSTMEDVLPLQKVGTRLWHSQIQNAMLANTVFVKYRPGSTAAGWLKAGNEIRARSKVPVTNPADFQSEVLGRELRSLAPELAAVDAMSKQLTVSDTVKGANLLGRTSRAAISLVQEAGLTVPNMDLDFFRDRLSEQLTMLYRNLGQWSIYGEEIPFRNPETRAIVMKAVEFPLDGLNSFTVRITASSDEETAQFEFERDMGLAKLQGDKFREFTEMVAPALNPNAPPVIWDLTLPQLVAQQLMLGRIMELAKLDQKKFTFSEKQLTEIFDRHKQWVEQQKQAQAQAAQNAPPAPPPPPKVSISLKGDLTAPQEQQLAANGGFAGAPGGATGGSVVQGSFGGGSVSPTGAPANPEGAPPMGI